MLETTSNVTASGSSGGTCSIAGPYFCSVHTDTVVFVRDPQKFPNCPISRNKKGHSATWYMMSDAQAVVPISTVDHLDTEAL